MHCKPSAPSSACSSPSRRPWRWALAPALLAAACAVLAQATTPVPPATAPGGPIVPTPTPGVPGAPPAATPPIRPPQAMPAEIVDDCARGSTTVKCSGAASRPGSGAASRPGSGAAAPGRRNVPTAAGGNASSGQPNCQSQCRLGATMAAECRPLCKEMAARPVPR